MGGCCSSSGKTKVEPIGYTGAVPDGTRFVKDDEDDGDASGVSAPQPPPPQLRPMRTDSTPMRTDSRTNSRTGDKWTSGSGERRLSRDGDRRPSLDSAQAIGTPFPKRPWGAKLSTRTWGKLEELFRRMDPDGSNAVSREEAQMFFKGTFGKISADAMFNEVDVDCSGAITATEFVGFWLQVRKKGYKEQEILEEVEEMLDGGAWVDWKDDRDTASTKVKFPTRPILCRLSGKVWSKCEELFNKIDGDGSLIITREKALKHFKGAFSVASVDAMFNEIDEKHHGQISPKEWMKFWIQVKANGYKDQDIIDEMEQLMDGHTWVDWKDGRNT